MKANLGSRVRRNRGGGAAAAPSESDGRLGMTTPLTGGAPWSAAAGGEEAGGRAGLGTRGAGAAWLGRGPLGRAGGKGGRPRALALFLSIFFIQKGLNQIFNTFINQNLIY